MVEHDVEGTHFAAGGQRGDVLGVSDAGRLVYHDDRQERAIATSRKQPDVSGEPLAERPDLGERMNWRRVETIRQCRGKETPELSEVSLRLDGDVRCPGLLDPAGPALLIRESIVA